MKHKIVFFTAIASCTMLVTLGSCKKDSGNVWEDSSNMGMYKRANERVLWGSAEQDAIASSDTSRKPFSFVDEEFVPLQDEDLKLSFSEAVFMQPKESPGDEYSSLPGIDGFSLPAGSLASIFETIHFDTDDYALKDTHHAMAIIKNASAYLKEHPKTFIFVAGHCDQRGPEAYNLALGTKRANAVRNSLIQQGVNPEQIHTISYGKEHPENHKNTPEAWAQNRRAQFKIYNKN